VHAALTVLSGPAGGAGGARLLADLAGESRTLCFDMGGTSCDVCVIDGGEVAETAEREIAGRPLALPALDIHTVGAGGGSIAWRDAGGALRVGPRSAGAVPGPACYGRGGTEPTVTDANLLLGRLLDDSALPGGIVLDRGAAERAIGHLGADLGLDPIACAAGIVRVAEAEMLGALRVMTVERGIDPRAFALMPFGGAGPLHAVALARELGIGRVICPRASGVLSALGLAAAPPRRDAARTLMLRGEELDDERLASERRAIVGRAVAALSGETERVRVTHELRYRGQSFELAVEERLGSSEGSVQGLGAQELRREFARAHVARYGYEDAESDVELVNLRASVWGPAPRLAPSAGSATPPERRRALVVFDDGPAEAAVLRGEPAAGTAATGPLVWALPEATLLVPPGWQATVDPHGTIHVRERGRTTRAPAHGGAG
jgi:N-methylhydantoinase A